MRNLFGTDGIRGVAGSFPLDEETVGRIGSALVATVRNGRPGKKVTVVIGCDTRESSPLIVDALAGGIRAASGEVRFAGVVPTPAAAFLTRILQADAGVSISASHNPWQDNGVKIFSGSGRKLPDQVEAAIEREIERARPSPRVETRAEEELARFYVDHLVESVPYSLKGLRVVIDAAHGAAAVVAPEAFRRAGADVIPLNVSPDGRNINAGCGALHPEAMARAVVAEKADLGIALDGDADRIMMADGEGRPLDGDDILYLWTLEMEREGRRPEFVVGTVMSNWGLEAALAERGVSLLRAPVGDRYVIDEMERSRALLGGEPSGHLIHAERTTTGDGTLTGLVVSALVAASGLPLAAQPRIERLPQLLLNVKVRERVPFGEIPGFAPEQARWEKRLEGEGRLLIRYSGTEALARVMVEGRDGALVRDAAEALASLLRSSLGAA